MRESHSRALFAGPYRVVSEARRHLTSAIRFLDRSSTSLARTLEFPATDPYAYQLEVAELLRQYRDLRPRLVALHRRSYRRPKYAKGPVGKGALTRASKYRCPEAPPTGATARVEG
jgi:hypothetical protein